MTAWGMGGRTRRPERTAGLGPDRVKTQTSGRLFMNFSRFSAFSAITGPAERKNSLQMRRFQTISEFSHGLGRDQPREHEARRRYVSGPPGIPICARKYRDFAMYPSRSPDPGVVSE